MDEYRSNDSGGIDRPVGISTHHTSEHSTLDKRGFSRSTKVIFGIIALLSALIFGVSIAGNIVQVSINSYQRNELVGLTNSQERVLRQYETAYNACEAASNGKCTVLSTPDQVRSDANRIASAGSQGPQGPTGRGIQYLKCNVNGTWTVRYTDNTSQTLAGPCRVVNK